MVCIHLGKWARNYFVANWFECILIIDFKEKSPWVYDWDKLLQYKYCILEKIKLFTIIIFSSGTTAIRHCKDVTSHVTRSVKLPIQISATLHICVKFITFSGYYRLLNCILLKLQQIVIGQSELSSYILEIPNGAYPTFSQNLIGWCWEWEGNLEH